MKWLIPVLAVGICCLFIGGLILVIEINHNNETSDGNSNGDLPVLGSVNGPAPASPVYANGNIQVFLKVDGVTGESTDAKHQGWIEVTSYNWTVATVSSSGRAAGYSAPGSFMVVAETSKASPVLFRQCASCRHLAAATIAVQSTDSSGKATDVCTWNLGDVVVTSYNTNYGVDGSGRLLDVYGFSASRFEVTVCPIQADGSPTSPVSSAFEFTQIPT